MHRYSCLLKQFHEAMSNNARATKQLCHAYITLATVASCQKPSFAHFDVHIASAVQYTLWMLFVGFRCYDSKDSQIVSLHIQNIVVIIFQTKIQFDIFFNFIHERLIKFETFLRDLYISILFKVISLC